MRTATASVIALGYFRRVDLLGDPLDKLARDGLLGHRLPVLGLAFGDEVDGVLVAAHRAFLALALGRGDVVGDDPVDALGLALAGGVLEHVLGLGRKAD